MNDDDGILEDRIRAVMRSIGGSIGAAISETDLRYGFALFVFELGPGGRVNFVSNTDRKIITTLLKDFVAQSERDFDRPPPPRR